MLLPVRNSVPSKTYDNSGLTSSKNTVAGDLSSTVPSEHENHRPEPNSDCPLPAFIHRSCGSPAGCGGEGGSHTFFRNVSGTLTVVALGGFLSLKVAVGAAASGAMLPGGHCRTGRNLATAGAVTTLMNISPRLDAAEKKIDIELLSLVEAHPQRAAASPRFHKILKGRFKSSAASRAITKHRLTQQSYSLPQHRFRTGITSAYLQARLRSRAA
jgi:hypothetical protein